MEYHVQSVVVGGLPEDLEKELNKIPGEIISVSFVGNNPQVQRIYTVVYKSR